MSSAMLEGPASDTCGAVGKPGPVRSGGAQDDRAEILAGVVHVLQRQHIGLHLAEGRQRLIRPLHTQPRRRSGRIAYRDGRCDAASSAASMRSSIAASLAALGSSRRANRWSRSTALWNGRKRERHDVVERHDDAHRPAATFAPAPERSAAHWIERTPSTARHSAGRISRSCSIRTECSAAAMSRRQ